MDKINNFAKQINFKNALVGGFDQESVYINIKKLISIFHEELTQKENLLHDYENEIKELNEQLNKKTIIENQQSESTKLKKYMLAYQETQKKVNDLQQQMTKKDEFIHYLKDTLEKEREDFQEEYNKLNQKLQPIKDDIPAQSINHIIGDFKNTLDSLQQYYQKSLDSFTNEKEELIKENEKLKTQIKEMNKQSDDVFVEYLNKLEKDIHNIKANYMKGNTDG